MGGLRVAELTGDQMVEVASGGQEFGKSLAEEYLEFALDDSCLLHKPLRDLRAGYGTEPGDSREGVVEELSWVRTILAMNLWRNRWVPEVATVKIWRDWGVLQELNPATTNSWQKRAVPKVHHISAYLLT